MSINIWGCIYTRDGYIILAIRLKSVMKILIYVTGVCNEKAINSKVIKNES